MTALTRTGRQRCPKGAPYERVSGQSHASRAAWLTTEALGWGICIYCAFYAAWLTTEVLGRGVCVCYATRDGVLIAERSVALHRELRGSVLSREEPCEGVASRKDGRHASNGREESRDAFYGSEKRFYAF